MATNNNNIPATNTDILQNIRTQKAEVRKQLKASSEFIRLSVNQLFAPPPKATSKIGSFMNMVDQGLALYDGIMMGMKVARNVRRIFGRRK